MTTTPAMPELPDTDYYLGFCDEGGDHLLGLRGYTADQMRAYALATLQSQPAEVSDEPEQASKVVNDSCWKFVEAMPHKIPGPIWNDLKPAIYAALIHYHRAILALRPQAVPMTEEQRREIFAAGYEAAEHDAAVCQVPPHGWRCTRKAGHEGPCAAVETDDAELVQRGMDRLRDITAPAGGEG